MPKFLKVKQAAEELATRQHTVLNHIKNGSLAAIDISLNPGGRPSWRISSEDLELFILRRQYQPRPKRRRRRRKQSNVTEFF